MLFSSRGACVPCEFSIYTDSRRRAPQRPLSDLHQNLCLTYAQRIPYVMVENTVMMDGVGGKKPPDTVKQQSISIPHI
jgi:hypothetical protein